MKKPLMFTQNELELESIRPLPTHDARTATEVAFPLGGIGAGCVSLSAQGRLVDWEIFNRPNKGSILPYSFFTLWANFNNGNPPVTRVLQAPPSPPFSGQGGGGYRGLGFGVTREDGSGLPHFQKATFKGEFPLAEILFENPGFPLEVRLEAFSPFIPLNPDDSSLPIAVLRWHLTNTSTETASISIVGSLFNAVGYPGSGPFVGNHLGGNTNVFVEDENLRGLYLTSSKYCEESPRFGSMALTTTWEKTFHQNASLRSGWFDAMHDFWNHLSATGALPERDYGPSEDGSSDVGSLGLMAEIAPGESVSLPFFISWHFPNFVKYWGQRNCCCDDYRPPIWKNYYASLWADALDVARYFVANEQRLYGETKLFHDVLFSSTLPSFVLDAVSSQASILHTPTVLRLPDGTFYGFEGCHSDAGCCEGSCTHVWNYAQTPAFLFPSLERSLRDSDYRYNMREDGHMGFRLQLPLGSPMQQFHAAADGQLGGLMKLYRDWLLSGDDEWLRDLWPQAKKALAYAWKEWDTDKDGVIEGIQHNTYDIEFYGPNTMIGSFYLGALRAAEEIATHLGEPDLAEEYRRIFESGRERMDRELFNGEWYVQKYDPEKTPKYQYGEGCLSDQMIGQWFAHIAGLGYLFEPEKVRSALRSVFQYNWRSDFWDHANPQRIYALNDEQGLLLCTWPRGARPEFPFVYSDEVWCGIEYQVASHLIYEGLLPEGLALVKGVRDRHDGKRRNPWNEFECGSHYARSLASWSVLTALSGFHFNMPHHAVGFAPKLNANNWQCFWSLGTGWGIYRQQLAKNRGQISLEVKYGRLPLAKLLLGSIDCQAQVKAELSQKHIETSTAVENDSLAVHFPPNTELTKGQAVKLQLEMQ